MCALGNEWQHKLFVLIHLHWEVIDVLSPVADLLHVFVENINQPCQYTGREAVGNTGLYYYRSRMMRSRNGAFTRQDDAIDGVNWYK